MDGVKNIIIPLKAEIQLEMEWLVAVTPDLPELVKVTDAVGAVVDVDIKVENAIVTLTPKALLKINTKYKVTVKGGANGVKGKGNERLTTDYVFTFTTGATPGNVFEGAVNHKAGAIVTWKNPSTAGSDHEVVETSHIIIQRNVTETEEVEATMMDIMILVDEVSKYNNFITPYSITLTDELGNVIGRMGASPVDKNPHIILNADNKQIRFYPSDQKIKIFTEGDDGIDLSRASNALRISNATNTIDLNPAQGKVIVTSDTAKFAQLSYANTDGSADCTLTREAGADGAATMTFSKEGIKSHIKQTVQGLKAWQHAVGAGECVMEVCNDDGTQLVRLRKDAIGQPSIEYRKPGMTGEIKIPMESFYVRSGSSKVPTGNLLQSAIENVAGCDVSTVVDSGWSVSSGSFDVTRSTLLGTVTRDRQAQAEYHFRHIGSSIAVPMFANAADEYSLLYSKQGNPATTYEVKRDGQNCIRTVFDAGYNYFEYWDGSNWRRLGWEMEDEVRFPMKLENGAEKEQGGIRIVKTKAGEVNRYSFQALHNDKWQGVVVSPALETPPNITLDEIEIEPHSWFRFTREVIGIKEDHYLIPDFWGENAEEEAKQADLIFQATAIEENKVYFRIYNTGDKAVTISGLIKMKVLE